MSLFTGTGVALVTPFDRKFEVDEVSLRKLVEHVIVGGADYLVALGTTSEAATLTEAERCRVMEIVLEQNEGRLPVMVGIGGNNTSEVIKNVKNFPFLDSCKAILSVTPYYNKPSQEGMYRHFRDVSESSPLPLFLYNVPGRTGVNLSSETVVRLSHDCPNIEGIKEASGNFQQITEILCSMRSDFTVLSGDDGITLPLLVIGARGVISVLANVFPGEFSTMVHLAAAGYFRGANRIHLKYTALYKALFAEGNPAGIKAALHAQGIIAENVLRLPLVPVSEGLYGKLQTLCHSM
ncbi:4-hydroxy-tetrahydrodipicolinate synthase [Odoribacter lunatus]|uniref:4-hydroxy-tetrahydrodipicolinate synthase n=1 Tax=Odoribacter lunatus TaxID=2941335 RepID=UPI00203F3620|nr:4-hydroxy-tetrahydrodipicolinate synthase [Odoribacter lunatus]